MNDPYLVLGVKSSASDAEIKKAYRDLVKQYHPDNYQNNPLADLAEEKMKEINEAYDAIVKMRTGGGYQAGHASGSGGYSGQGGGDQIFYQVRQLLNQGKLGEAERLLQSAPTQNAEWYYLSGMLASQRGWLDEAKNNLWKACSMDPGNMEYRQSMSYLNAQSTRGFQQYQSGGMSTGDCCMALMCTNCLCDCCT